MLQVVLLGAPTVSFDVEYGLWDVDAYMVSPTGFNAQTAAGTFIIPGGAKFCGINLKTLTGGTNPRVVTRVHAKRGGRY